MASGSVRASVACGSRVPTMTVWPSSSRRPAIARPTEPVPRTAMFMREPVGWESRSRQVCHHTEMDDRRRDLSTYHHVKKKKKKKNHLRRPDPAIPRFRTLPRRRLPSQRRQIASSPSWAWRRRPLRSGSRRGTTSCWPTWPGSTSSGAVSSTTRPRPRDPTPPPNSSDSSTRSARPAVATATAGTRSSTPLPRPHPAHRSTTARWRTGGGVRPGHRPRRGCRRATARPGRSRPSSATATWPR